MSGEGFVGRVRQRYTLELGDDAPFEALVLGALVVTGLAGAVVVLPLRLGLRVLRRSRRA